MVFPEDDESYAPKPLLTSIRNFEQLEIPDPWQAPGMSTVLEAAKKVVAQAGNDFYIQANIDCGPFSMAGVLRGVEHFLTECLTEDALLLSDYLDFCAEVIVAYGKEMIGTGVHGVQFGDAVSGLVNADMFAQLAIPYQHKVADALRNDHCDLQINRDSHRLF